MGKKKNPNKAAFPREYQTWKGMRKRCRNPRCADFKNYGGRGIRVCARWDSFDLFMADMGPCPVGLFIDRVDNDGNYEPNNCRWATRLEQNRNKRNIEKIPFNGAVVSRIEAESELGFTRGRIRDRLRKGWTLEEAISTPQRPTRPHRPPIP